MHGGIDISPRTDIWQISKLRSVQQLEEKTVIRDSRLAPKIGPRVTVSPKFSLQSGLELCIVRLRV